jgi:putative flippase GtrA
MRKFERILKIISLTIGTITFGFLAWLMLIYQNFEETTAFIIGGVMMAAILYAVSRWGYLFIDD